MEKIDHSSFDWCRWGALVFFLPSLALAVQADLIRPMEAIGNDRLVGETPQSILASSQSTESGEIRITGTAQANITFSYPASVSLQNGGRSITLQIDSSPSNQNILLDSNGHGSIFLGGRFSSVPASHPRGDYTGSFNVTVPGVASPVSVSVRVTLQQGLSITTNGNLQYGNLVQGDGPATISPEQTEGRAWLTVRGEPNRQFQVDLSATEVTLTRDGSGSGAGILVNNFQTQRPNVLNASGTAEIYLGASRGAIPSNLPRGQYSADLNLTVRY